MVDYTDGTNEIEGIVVYANSNPGGAVGFGNGGMPDGSGDAGLYGDAGVGPDGETINGQCDENFWAEGQATPATGPTTTQTTSFDVSGQPNAQKATVVSALIVLAVARQNPNHEVGIGLNFAPGPSGLNADPIDGNIYIGPYIPPGRSGSIQLPGWHTIHLHPSGAVNPSSKDLASLSAQASIHGDATMVIVIPSGQIMLFGTADGLRLYGVEPTSGNRIGPIGGGETIYGYVSLGTAGQ